jgi:hypothetical protein
MRQARARKSLADRFWLKVDRRAPDECWPWLGTRHAGGYGRISLGGRADGMVRATHVAILLATGQRVPAGMEACHTCDNPPCVNPRHLFIGTPADNSRDMATKGRQRMPGLSGDLHPLRLNPERAARGEGHGCSVLTAEQVRAIRADAAAGARVTHIARRYGVARPTVWRIVQRETWRHV